MQHLASSSRGALRLAEGTRLECDWRAGIFTLRVPGGAIPLNEIAARILRLCDGSMRRREVLIRLGHARTQRSRAQHIEAFIDAAQKRRWITEAGETG